MLFSRVFAAAHPRRSLDSFSRLTPISYPLRPNSFICHTSRNSPVSPTIATDPKLPLSKSCICHTSETTRGIPVPHQRSDVQIEAPLRLWSGDHDAVGTRNHFNVFPTYPLSFHILAHSLARRKTQLFYFQAIPHSTQKHPGVGGTAVFLRKD